MTGLYKKRKTKAYICDIDGCLADSELRDFFKEQIEKNDFSWFEVRIPDFPPIESMTRLVFALKNEHRIVYLTARSSSYRRATIKWLKKFLLWDNVLFMRPDNNRDKDYVVKEVLLKQILEKYDVVGAIDDNAQCVDMYRQYGIPTYHFSFNKTSSKETT